jgi:hypothetical protein
VAGAAARSGASATRSVSSGWTAISPQAARSWGVGRRPRCAWFMRRARSPAPYASAAAPMLTISAVVARQHRVARWRRPERRSGRSAGLEPSWSWQPGTEGAGARFGTAITWLASCWIRKTRGPSPRYGRSSSTEVRLVWTVVVESAQRARLRSGPPAGLVRRRGAAPYPRGCASGRRNAPLAQACGSMFRRRPRPVALEILDVEAPAGRRSSRGPRRSGHRRTR